MQRVIVTDFISNEDLRTERRILSGIATVDALDALDESELVGRIEDADAIMLYHNLSITQKTIARLRNCKLIVRCGVGIDNVDHEFAGARGIAVANVPDYGTEDVADSAIAMFMTLCRGVHPMNSSLRDRRGPWSYTQAAPLRRLRGSTMGVIGIGRIGTAAALRFKALGLNVIFYDPFVADGTEKALGLHRAESLEELLPKCLGVSLHCPLTPKTRHLMNGRTIALMPRGSYLINTARGDVVDTTALPDALASGQLAGAGIDVLGHEPPTGSEPLLVAWRDPTHRAYDRLIVNPHAAFYSEEGLMDMRIKGAEACRRALVAEPVRNLVNRPIPLA